MHHGVVAGEGGDGFGAVGAGFAVGLEDLDEVF